MERIPFAKAGDKVKTRISPSNAIVKKDKLKVVFSFESVDTNEYFNLDGTCQNWSFDLFQTMQKVSKLEMNDIYSGKYSGKHSPMRIHRHEKAIPPCKVPCNISLDNMWQIRISRSKGGIHGIFVDNVFYVIWFDPQHNLYPDENHGGLKKIKPPSSCCKERDHEIDRLIVQIDQLKKDCEFWEGQCTELEKEKNNT